MSLIEEEIKQSDPVCPLGIADVLDAKYRPMTDFEHQNVWPGAEGEYQKVAEVEKDGKKYTIAGDFLPEEIHYEITEPFDPEKLKANVWRLTFTFAFDYIGTV